MSMTISRGEGPPLDAIHVPVGRSVGIAPSLSLTDAGKKLARLSTGAGIGLDDIDYNGGDIAAAILENYRKPGGGYDLDAAAHDFFRWPPIAARVKELKRERWQRRALHDGVPRCRLFGYPATFRKWLFLRVDAGPGQWSGSTQKRSDWVGVHLRGHSRAWSTPTMASS
jgi:hypothetical protein